MVKQPILNTAERAKSTRQYTQTQLSALNKRRLGSRAVQRNAAYQAPPASVKTANQRATIQTMNCAVAAAPPAKKGYYKGKKFVYRRLTPAQRRSLRLARLEDVPTGPMPEVAGRQPLSWRPGITVSGIGRYRLEDFQVQALMDFFIVNMSAIDVDNVSQANTLIVEFSRLSPYPYNEGAVVYFSYTEALEVARRYGFVLPQGQGEIPFASWAF